MEGNKKPERMGWVERFGENLNFYTLSLLPLKVSPNPTTQ